MCHPRFDKRIVRSSIISARRDLRIALIRAASFTRLKTIRAAGPGWICRCGRAWLEPRHCTALPP
jgi:hypothetical protein